MVRAQNWGFVCQYQKSGYWQILAHQPHVKWTLEQTEARWILIVKEVPQLLLQPEEAIAFLEKRRLEIKR
ncbi:hypothetical protein [Myxosarcina sp. GI1(2024)]